MGDILSSPLQGLELPKIPHKAYPELMAEQEISGLCMHFFNLSLFRLCSRPVFTGSTVCFVLASLDYPDATHLIFGRNAGEMEEVTWEYLTTVGSDERDDGGLSMMLRMTRLDDLGLGQLLFP